MKYGQLICSFDGSESGPPPDHTMYFAGEYPCDDQGAPIEALRNSSERQELAKGLWVDHYFSARPMGGTYEDYRHKITHYAHVIGTVCETNRPRSRCPIWKTGAVGRSE